MPWPGTQLARCFGNWAALSVILTVSLGAGFAADVACRNRLDLVFVLDATSSYSAALFEEAKAQLKAAVSGLIIGSRDIRLALVSVVGQTGQTVANFDNINSHADFNAAVDRVPFASGPVDMAAGMRTARESVLPRPRAGNSSRVLALVKDRRHLAPLVADASNRARISAEATAARSAGVAVHAVGIGGVWNREELEALFGTDYLRFNNRIGLPDAMKSLNSHICPAKCPDSGKVLLQPGPCYFGTRQVLRVQFNLTEDENGLSVCRKTIQATYEACSTGPNCTESRQDVGKCKLPGQVVINSHWLTANSAKTGCEWTSETSKVDCKDGLKCIRHRVLDVLFVVELLSHRTYHAMEIVKEAMNVFLRPLDVGADGSGGTRVALMRFSWDVHFWHRLGSQKKAILDYFDSYNGSQPETNTASRDGLAIEAAYDYLTSGDDRRNVQRIVFLISSTFLNGDGASFARKMQDSGIQLYQLQGYTSALIRALSRTFFRQICTEIGDSQLRVCVGSKFHHRRFDCVNGKQQVARTSFVYDVEEVCLKTVHSQVTENCQNGLTCISPRASDVVFIIERSVMMNGSPLTHGKEAIATLLNLMDFGPRTRLGLMEFQHVPTWIAKLGATKRELLDNLNGLGDLTLQENAGVSSNRWAYVDFAFNLYDVFTDSAEDLQKIVFLVTIGNALNHKDFLSTAQAAAQLRSRTGIVVFIIGVSPGNMNLNQQYAELRQLTDSDTKLAVLPKDRAKLHTWARVFCAQFADSDAKQELCSDNALEHTRFQCVNDTQQVTRTKFVHDASRNCLKSVQYQVAENCRSTCVDPIKGVAQFYAPIPQHIIASGCVSFNCDNFALRPVQLWNFRCADTAGQCQINDGLETGRGITGRFSCHDEKGLVSDNCRCLRENLGTGELLIDTF